METSRLLGLNFYNNSKLSAHMKKCISSVCLLCGLAASAGAQTGVVGINTENPQGILHIDGASTPGTINPATGAVGDEQAADDIVVDAQGRIGLGLLAPQTKIDFLPSTTAGSLLRIQDGTEGAGKFLFSDDKGVGTWASLASGSWYASLHNGTLLGYTAAQDVRKLDNYAGALISPTGGGAIDPAAGSITLPVAGKYRITISIYWECNRVTGNHLAKGILRLDRGGQVSDRQTFTLWGGGGNTGSTESAVSANGLLPSFTYILELDKDDVLTLATDETAINSANRAQAVLFFVELLL